MSLSESITAREKQPISAEAMNEVFDEVRRLGKILESLPARGEGDAGLPTWYRCRVKKVNAPAGWSQNNPPLPSQVTYDLELIGLTESADLTGVKPDIGRPVRGDEAAIWPCDLGQRGWVMRFPENGGLISTLVVLQEYVMFSLPCGTSG